MWKSFDKSDAPAIGVAPIIAGPARKGPTAKLMRQFGSNSARELPRAITATFSTPISWIPSMQRVSDNLARHAVAAKTLMLTSADLDALATTVLAAADDPTAAGTLRLQEEGDGKTRQRSAAYDEPKRHQFTGYQQ